MTVLQKEHRQNGYSKFKNFKKKKGKADLGWEKTPCITNCSLQAVISHDVQTYGRSRAAERPFSLSHLCCPAYLLQRSHRVSLLLWLEVC